MNTHYPQQKRALTLAERRLLAIGRVFFVLIVLSFFSYFFFLIQTVQAVGERKEIRKETEELQSTVASLEITYYEKVHTFGLATLSDFGYQSTQPRFLMADGTTVEDTLASAQ